MGKAFPEEFNRIDKVKSGDKIMINDSEDGVNKYATPGQFNASLKELETHYEDAVKAKEDAQTAATEAAESATEAENSAEAAEESETKAKEYSDSIKASVTDIANCKSFDERLKRDLGLNMGYETVTLTAGETGKYVKCSTRSAASNSSFAISAPFSVESSSEILIKTGYNPSDSSHKPLDISVISLYEEMERLRTVQKEDQDGNPLYYEVDEDGNPTEVETTTDTGYIVYTTETYTESRYLPNSEDKFVSLPDSGYYVAIIPQTCKVVVSYKPGVTDTEVIIVKHGVLANIASQLFGFYEHRTMVEAMLNLAMRVAALENRNGRLGNATAGVLDVSDITRYRYPTVLYGHGVPAADVVPVNLPAGLPWDGVPVFIGQLYINLDATSEGLYYATGHDSLSEWKQA